jgi:hypothetical protein
MTGSVEDHLARFSGKTRSTLRRKARKLADEAEGALDMSEHRTPAQVERFLAEALPLSALTYQARLQDAGLPADAVSRAAMLEQAEQGRMRCFLLLGALAAFDGSVAAAKLLAERSGALAQARKLLRG